jgi:hypothetical protein
MNPSPAKLKKYKPQGGLKTSYDLIFIVNGGGALSW